MAIRMLKFSVSKMASGRQSQRIIPVQHVATTSRVLASAASSLPSPSPSPLESHREVRGMAVMASNGAGDYFRSTATHNINIINSNNSSSSIQIRNFGRKASKLGHHLETAEDLASRPDRIAAKNRRKKKKEQKNKKGSGGGGRHHPARDDGSKAAKDTSSEESSEEGEQQQTSASTSMAAMEGGDVDLQIEQDATETKFEHGSEDGIPLLPDTDDVKDRMLKVVTAMEQSFRAIRGAEPTPELFDSISVRAYGELTPLSSVAQVVITSPNQATLTCYDPETAPAVRDAVRDSGLNFNPRIEEGDGGVVVVPIPKVSMETRKTLARQLGKAAEASRQRVRRIRRAAQDVVKKGKDGKLEGVSKDDAFRVGKDIDSVTEEVVTLLNRKVEEKQDSVMAV